MFAITHDLGSIKYRGGPWDKPLDTGTSLVLLLQPELRDLLVHRANLRLENNRKVLVNKEQNE